MTKEIRILTGAHAGAKLQMSPGIWKMGCEDNMDVQLTDWKQAPATIEIGVDGSVKWISANADGVGESLTDLLPIRFGDIVLCVGDAAANWPTDADLLEKLNAPFAAAKPKNLTVPRSAQPLRRWLVAGGAALMATLASTAFIPGQTSQAKVLPSTATLLQKVQNALVNSNQSELHALLEGDRIIVYGLVRGNAEAIALKEKLRKIVPSNLLIDFTNVADVIANIQDSVHDSAVKVRYEGGGKFSVIGAVRNPTAVQKTVSQVEADFGSNIKIALNLTPVKQKWDIADSASALISGSLQYVQAVDGSKHFPPFSTLNEASSSTEKN